MEKCLIIAEAGVNHNGSLDLAYKLCDKAKESGADVVKFQTWKTENIITKSVAQAEYQKDNTGKEQSQFDMLKELELSYDDFRKVKKYCDKIGIIFASTPDDEESLDFLMSLDLPFIKVGSGEIGNIHYLRKIGATKKPIILSTGMSTIADIDISLQALRDGGAEDITLLHCTTNYPCAYEDVNLNAMLTLKEAFKCNVGYSDHTMGTTISTAAVALGAKVIEKHFTLDRNMEGPDHLASTEPAEFRTLVDNIRAVEIALGDGIKKMRPIEESNAKVVKKRIVAKRDLQIGHIINEDDICVKRNDIGLTADMWDYVIGKKIEKNIFADEGII